MKVLKIGRKLKCSHKEKLHCIYCLMLVELKKRRQYRTWSLLCIFFSSALSSIVGISISDCWKEQKGPDSKYSPAEYLISITGSSPSPEQAPDPTSYVHADLSHQQSCSSVFASISYLAACLHCGEFWVNTRSMLWFPHIRDGSSYCENVSRKYPLTSGKGKVSTKLADRSDKFCGSYRQDSHKGVFHKIPSNKLHKHS